jgi:hypothetical protein
MYYSEELGLLITTKEKTNEAKTSTPQVDEFLS